MKLPGCSGCIVARLRFSRICTSREPITTAIRHPAHGLGRGCVADAEAHAHRHLHMRRMRGMASATASVSRWPAPVTPFSDT